MDKPYMEMFYLSLKIYEGKLILGKHKGAKIDDSLLL